MRKISYKFMLLLIIVMVSTFPSMTNATSETLKKDFENEFIVKNSQANEIVHAEQTVGQINHLYNRYQKKNDSFHFVKSGRTTKGNQFTDLKASEPGYNEVLALVEKGIITGYNDGTFKPYNKISRQHFAVMLYRALDLDKPKNINQILANVSDVSPKHDYALEIATIMNAGILQGANGKVNPNANITRGQMASMLVRSFNLKDLGTNVNLADLKKIDRAHRNNVKIIAQHEITLGKLNKKNERYFAANDFLNRVQFATLFHRTLKLSEQEKVDPVEINLSEFEQEVVRLTNNERRKFGLVPLKVDLKLSEVAQEKSRDMAKNDYFDHDSPVYGSPFEMMALYGIDYLAAGENIASGFRTPEAAVKAWMDSPGHRQNILNKQYTHIGVGYEQSGNLWTQQFIKK